MVSSDPMPVAGRSAGRSSVGGLAAVLVSVLVLAVTRPTFIGDALLYVYGIDGYRTGELPLAQLFEFGHLLWRPLGALVSALLGPWLVAAFDWTPALAITAVLIGLSLLSAVGTVFLFERLAGRVTPEPWAPGLLAVAFLTSNAFLNYSQSGSSYVPGLFLLSLATWLALGARFDERPRPARALAAGAALAGSVTLWTPYVLSVPAVVLLPLVFSAGDLDPRRARRDADVRFATWTLAACLGILVLVFSTGALLAGVRSGADLRDWTNEAAHGWSQRLRLLRLPTGVARAFADMGDDGILLKRFLLRDPYERVGLLDVLGGGLWKVVLVHLALLVAVGQALRDPVGRRACAVLALAAVPVVLFAVLVFEPSSPERYFPAFPFLLLVLAAGLRRPPARRAGVAFVLSAFATIGALNVRAAWPTSAAPASTLEAAASLKDRLPAASLVALPTLRDPLYRFAGTRPFHPLNRPGLPVYDVVKIATRQVETWREEFADRALDSWRRGGDVWVSSRLTAERPHADWGWVEGDDPRIRWRDLTTFFRSLAFDERLGGDDGFRRVAKDEPNLAVLERASGSRGAERAGRTLSSAAPR
jgi:hypothetical protein